jgi:hypothetical protein
MPLAYIVNPVGEVHNVHGIGRVLAGIFELFIILQFEKLLIIVLGKIFEVDVGKASEEILPLVVKKGLLLENCPVVL